MCRGCTFSNWQIEYPWLDAAIKQQFKSDLRFQLDEHWKPELCEDTLFGMSDQTYYLLGLICLRDKQIKDLEVLVSKPSYRAGYV